MSPRLSPDANFPDELIVDILARLDCVSLLKCTQACRLFKSLIYNTSGLRLTIELYAAGQQEIYTSPLISPAASDRLDVLKRHQIAWGELAWVTEQHIPMLDGGLWELYGGVLAQNNPNGDIVFCQLPSEIRSIKGRDWNVGGFDFVIRDFGMDPSQDLLVLVEDPKWSEPHSHNTYRFHIRTMSTGADHPLALQPIICHPAEPNFQPSYAIQTSAEFLGILFIMDEGENELLIWEWKTGVIEIAIVGDEIRAFSFLNENFIVMALLTNTDSHDLDDEALEPILAILNFREEPNERRGVQELENMFVFRYPTLNADAAPIQFEIRSDPSPAWAPNSNIRVPFFTAQYNRLYAVSLWLLIKDRIHCVMLFVPSATFLVCIEKDTFKDRIYEWSSWGPRGTRILLPCIPPSDVWVCYVNGSRYVALRRGAKKITLDVYNFNRQGILRAMSQDGYAKTGGNYVTDTSVLEENIFQSVVETSLPYQIQSLPLDLKTIRGVAVVCSEDSIIIIDTHASRNEYRVLTF